MTKEIQFKVGDKIKYKDSYLYERPAQHQGGSFNEYEIRAIDESNRQVFLFEIDNSEGISGANYYDFTWAANFDNIEIITKEKVDYSLGEYEEPSEDEMDENCVIGCRPGEHVCPNHKLVEIKLIQVGRGKANETFTIKQKGRTEQELGEIALEKCKFYLASQDVQLEPDEKKGNGFWKVRVGMGYHVGDVEIKL